VTTFGTFDIDSVPAPSPYDEFLCPILPTDRKPVGKLTHVRLVSQGFGYQVHEWRDEAGQLWHKAPGCPYEYVGSDPRHNGC
jgi:hypothetical protein